MIEKLISIPGPDFLIIYSVYAGIIIFLIKVIAKQDYTSSKDIPEVTKLEPLDLALLRNGIKGAINTSLYNLVKKGALKITSHKKSVRLTQKNGNVKFNPLEKALFKFANPPKYYKEFFRPRTIKSFDQIVLPNKNRLKKQKLVPDHKVKRQYTIKVLLGLILLLGLGGLKLYAGIINEKSILFLVILMFISTIALLMVTKPFKVKTSALGNKVVRNAKQRFGGLRGSGYGHHAHNDNFDNDMLYGVAAFGIGAFAGSEISEHLGDSVHLDDSSSFFSFGNGCAGCGNSDTDSGGGCSSGCSGGCGGGCGGCGGD